jgi:2-polyprenyl-3-methyl-5-hydroxy-6-metoxy-1,4-benzoquinol methylase
METITQCPVCANSAFSEYLVTQDYFLTRENFTIQKCVNCGLKFTNPRPSKDRLPGYYESTDYISHSNVNKGLINKIYRMVRNYALSKKASFIRTFVPAGRILDIGCGTGEFLATMKKFDFEPAGIEPNRTAREFATKNYNLTVYDEPEIVKIPSHQFDVISLWHVLEHVVDLDERILQIKKWIKKDGILIVALPNPSSWDAKYYGAYWAAYDCPRHLYHFDKQSVKKLFEKFGFKIIRYKPMVFDSFYVSLLSEKYKQSKFAFPKGFYSGFISNVRAKFNQGNYSSIIYVLKQNKA